jgi:hypothetical protein
MTFHTYPDAEQARLAKAIRANANQHQATALHLWRIALEQVNPELMPVPPYCQPAALVDVYSLLDVAG